MIDDLGFKFRNWDIYKDALKFRSIIYETANLFPKEERFGLTDQLRRASLSIILNIAESANKSTDKERRVYINRAHYSLDEVVAGLDCALDENLISKAHQGKVLEAAASLAKRLKGFTNFLAKQ